MRKDTAVAILFFIPGVVFGVALDRYWLFTSTPVVGGHAGVRPASESGTGSVETDGLSRRDRILQEFDVTNLRIPVDQIHSGGPPKDGIPAITDPQTVPVSEADFLQADARVVGITLNGESRAYPIAVLNHHEAINDTVGGVPVGIIFCPLCDSVSVVDRRIEGKTLEFGISGLLMNSNVLLYDRTDHALWSQVKLEAVSGPLSGQSLKHLPFEITPFGDWSKAHADATVTTFKTGYRRNYNANPYAGRGLFTTDRLMFPVDHQDDRLGVKDRVIGVQVDGEARAYPLAAIAATDIGTITDNLAGQRVVLSERPGDGGVVVSSVPEGARVVHTFWFAWAAFHPHTEIYGQPPADGSALESASMPTAEAPH